MWLKTGMCKCKNRQEEEEEEEEEEAEEETSRNLRGNYYVRSTKTL